MRRVVCRELGPPERLGMEDKDDPVPKPGQIVVDVRAAGVTHVDARIVSGNYPMRLPTPFTPGHEFAGVVSSVGDGVDTLAVGDPVLAMAGMGAFASKVKMRAFAAFRVPERLSLQQAGSLLQSYSTALLALTRRTTVQSGDTVLVLGAGGGIGLAAIDVARAFGARVIAAASSEDKLAAARSQGAGTTIAYEADDLRAHVLDLHAEGVDVVVDPVGGRHRDTAMGLLRSGGSLLAIGSASGDDGCVPTATVSLRNRTILGVDGGDFGMHDPAAYFGLLSEALTMAAEGRISPVAPSERPLDEAGAVLTDILERRITGKVVLVP